MLMERMGKQASEKVEVHTLISVPVGCYKLEY
jgi:hypothetical protein